MEGGWGVETMLLIENWEPDGPELLKQESEKNGAMPSTFWDKMIANNYSKVTVRL